jgi:hypothetical protein
VAQLVKSIGLGRHVGAPDFEGRNRPPA